MKLIPPLSPPRYSSMSPMHEDPSQVQAADEDHGINYFLAQINPTQATWAPTKSLDVDDENGHDIWNCGQRAPWNTTFENLPPSPAVDENDGPTSFNLSPSSPPALLRFTGQKLAKKKTIYAEQCWE